MMHLLAEADTGVSIGSFINAAGPIASLCVSLVVLFKMQGGKDGERQIEPTAIAAIQHELKTQTHTLSKLDREMGGVTSSVDTIKKELVEIRVNHRNDIEGMHSRIGGISRELAGTTARVDGLEKRESPHGT